jgi:hypothetical protein
METKKITLIAVLASAYAVLSFLPGLPMIGAEGATIDLVRMLEIGYGLVLGPVYGPLAAFIGAVVGRMLKGGGFSLFFTPLAALTPFVAAMIGRENGRYWWVAAGVEAALVASWYLFETGRIVWYFPAMHVVSLIVLFVLRKRISNWINSEDRSKMSIGVFICSFISTVTGHMLGNLIFLILLSPEPILFATIMVVSILERVGISIGATIFATSLLIAVRKIYPELLN